MIRVTSPEIEPDDMTTAQELETFFDIAASILARDIQPESTAEAPSHSILREEMSEPEPVPA
jgi:hypothetical protein